jgi:peptidoglycan/LPS O-acetylase OafA/YrhL
MRVELSAAPVAAPSHTAVHEHGKYRRDVDGLRAVAVLLVLLYHGFPRVFVGGFIGVDVFFIISGYLITGIILDGLHDGSFTFRSFYARRVRRIFPALTVVLAVCPLIGYVVLLPGEFQQLGRHIASGAAFISNLTLLREVGYFDAAAESKPLLHLWSLAVEEQYYLVWPLVLFMLRRHLERARWWIVAIALGSFALNLLLTVYKPSLAFYSPVTRFWELMLGGLLVYAARLRAPVAGEGSPMVTWRDARVPGLPIAAADLAAGSGIALIAAGLAFIDNGPGFPGWRALAPTLGAALIIGAGPRAWLNRVVLSHPWFVWTGLISYPLYLWHWPLLTFARLVAGGKLGVLATIVVLLASVVLAWLTYRFIERRVRFPHHGKPVRWVTPAVVATMTSLGVTGVLAGVRVLEPRSSELPVVSKIEAALSDREPVSTEHIAGRGPGTVLFIGDSHMQHYVPRIRSLARSHAGAVRNIDIRTLGGCAPVPDVERLAFPCAEFVHRAFEHAASPYVDTVVLSASWEGFVTRGDYYAEHDRSKTPIDLLSPQGEWVFAGLERTLASLSQQGKRVVVVLSSSRGRAMDPKTWVDRGLAGLSPHPRDPVPLQSVRALSADIDRKLEEIAARIHAQVVDPMQVLCTNSVCPAVDEDGAFIFSDSSHLRASFVKRKFSLLDRFVLL